MPQIFQDDYGTFRLPEGQVGYLVVTPTSNRYEEADGTDVRLDRVRVYDGSGQLVKSYLRDTMGRRFADNLPGTEDDPEYLKALPTRENRNTIKER